MIKIFLTGLMVIAFCSCSEFDKKHELIKQNEEALRYILSPSHFVGKKALGRYKLNDIFSNQDNNLVKLKKSGLFNGEVSIFYSSAQCISLIIRTKKKFAGGFIDYVISNNLNEFDFACGLHSIYNLNQDDEVNELKIKVKETNSLLTLAVVEGD